MSLISTKSPPPLVISTTFCQLHSFSGMPPPKTVWRIYTTQSHLALSSHSLRITIARQYCKCSACILGAPPPTDGAGGDALPIQSRPLMLWTHQSKKGLSKSECCPHGGLTWSYSSTLSAVICANLIQVGDGSRPSYTETFFWRHDSFIRGGVGSRRVFTSLLTSVARLRWSPARSDLALQPRSQRRRWSLSEISRCRPWNLWTTYQVFYNIQKACVRLRSSFLGTSCRRKVKIESSWDGRLGG